MSAITATAPLPSQTPPEMAEHWLATVAAGLRARSLAPYLGPEVLAPIPGGPTLPNSYPALAAFFASKVALPKRVRGNPWAAAQFIESNRHRATLTQIMKAAFAPEIAPTPLHHALAAWAPPLIVDTWYDASVRQAFAGRADFAELQGINRAGIGEERWFRAYASNGAEVAVNTLADLGTILYKPHGCIQPAANFLVTDADYVEVLTEIDIQTPIPELVRQRRGQLGFVFLGCRFHDQMLRTYARQILKRSQGPHFALFAKDDLTRMERRFMAELAIDVLFCPLDEAVARLIQS